MAIFLMNIGHNEKNRMLNEQFQQYGETISIHFHNVLKAIVIYSIKNKTPLSSNTKQQQILAIL